MVTYLSIYYHIIYTHTAKIWYHYHISNIVILPYFLYGNITIILQYGNIVEYLPYNRQYGKLSITIFQNMVNFEITIFVQYCNNIFQ